MTFVTDDTIIEAFLVTVHSPTEKRGSMSSNTLRDAQKRQKAPFRAATLGFSVTSATLHSQKTPRVGWL